MNCVALEVLQAISDDLVQTPGALGGEDRANGGD